MTLFLDYVQSEKIRGCKIISTFVFNVGPYVERFEGELSVLMQARRAVVVANVTAAL